MTTRVSGLGRLFEIGTGIHTVNLNAANNTAKAMAMQNCVGVGCLVYKSASGTTDDLACDLQEAVTATGTPQDLDIITDYWVKSETLLDNDEVWTLTTQTAASEITAIAGTAELEIMLYFEVMADQLSDTYTHILCNVPDLGATDTGLGGVIYIPFGLKTQRNPANMPSLLTPGTANA